ncbi:MAG TPA: TIGR02996 domain-containing protein [Gemmata sp.]
MTPNNGTLLLRAILANPDEDSPRLMFADWLDESDRPAARARARFIRAQVQSHREGAPDGAEVRDLFRDWWQEWFGYLTAADPSGFMCSLGEPYKHPAILGYFPVISDDDRWTENANYRLTGDWGTGPTRCTDYYCWWLVQRGFVSVVRAHWPHWLRFGASICVSQPVTEVILSTAPADSRVNHLHWPSVRTWTTAPDDFRFWTERPAWAGE